MIMGQVNEKSSIGTTVSKKLVNEPGLCVTDSLNGYIRTNSHLKLLEGINVVVRSDLHKLKEQNKVVLITGGGGGHEPFAVGYVGYGFLTACVVGDVFTSPSSSTVLQAIRTCFCDAGVLLIVTNYTGGGSGHEPAHIGYVAEGMLTAAVCGDVFTSPSSRSILNTIQTCATTAGVLLIVKNYTGDRLNFGKASEIAKAEGINVEMVVVGEDCALTSKDRSAGRRGLCGTIFVHKMAGAMAEEGKSLQEIALFLNEATTEMGTISISLSPCSIPGQPSNFTISDDEVEFGLGIHGEAGVARIKMNTASSLVKQMIDHMWNSGYLPSMEGKEIAMFVNNLGGTSNLELSIIANEALSCLDALNVSVKRCYVGTFVTSLEMAGVSLTMMILNDERLKYLDSPCNAPAWPRNGMLNKLSDIMMPLVTKQQESEFVLQKAEGLGISLCACLKKACTALIDNESKLNELDRAAGDGDTGTTLARGAKGIFLKISNDTHLQLPVNEPRDLFLQLANDLESSMGGSSGALISLFFTAAANGLKEGCEAKDFVKAFQLGTSALKKYGGAEEGDRTMLDALYPSLHSLNKSLQANDTPANMLKDAAKAARSGADATLSMHAKAGRASYVSDTRLTHPDPGAVAVALVLEAIEKAYNKLKN